MFVVFGCSTKNNTLLTRSYHKLTSRYNIFFNGHESFKRGVDRINKQFEYDFTRILPVFTYTNPELARAASVDMDRAIAKASKIITTKSITAKPQMPDRQLSPRETNFLRQNEFNKWVIESYLLMGKAHFYKHDFSAAIKTFQFMQNQFPESNAIWNSQIWLSRAYLETGRNKEAKIILDKLDLDSMFPERLNAELYASLADYYLKANDLPNAIVHLHKSLENTQEKKSRLRYTYILAQLYSQTNNQEQSYKYFRRVLNMNPPYEMAFNANINMALTSVAGTSSDEKIFSDLKKMLRDEKNKYFEDKIYFALGNIALRKGNKAEAMEYLLKASEAGLPDAPQKIIINLALGEIALQMPDYVKASEHFDKVAAIITPDYPGFDSIQNKSTNLNKLAGNIKSFHLEDSVQALARLPEFERNRIIDNIIAAERQAMANLKMAEADLLREQHERIMRTAPVSQMQANGTGDNVWYFYNQSAVNFGKAEFESIWGRRTLEDNWRRSSKQFISSHQLAEHGIQDSLEESELYEETTDITSREFYLKNIPFSPEQFAKSHARIEEALFNMGKIFKNDFKDFAQAIWSFEELNRRYPLHSQMDEVIYNLHELNIATGNFSGAEFYKNQLVQRFPQSMYANILINPNYLNDLLEKENKIENLYQETFRLFGENLHARVIHNANFAINTYPESNLISKFMFLRAISTNKLGNAELFRLQLAEIIEKFPGTEIQASSSELIKLLDIERPEIAEKIMIEEAQDLYSSDTSGPHFIIFAVENNQVIINQLVFNLINFNFDFFYHRNLQLVTENFSSEKSLIKAEKFESIHEASEYYSKALVNSEILVDIPEGSFKLFYISQNNLHTLQSDKSLEKYLKVFNLLLQQKK